MERRCDCCLGLRRHASSALGFVPDVGDANQTKRIVRIDGEPVSSPAALAERLRLVWLIPAMDRRFTTALRSGGGFSIA